MDSSSNTLSSSGPLRKGQACIYCRRRKIRCDGQKPVCGNCRRGNREEDCEYTDRPGSQTQMEGLEESISRLQARIRELENPPASRAPSVDEVLLRRPYSDRNTAGSSRPDIPTAEPPAETIPNVVDSFLKYGANFGFCLYSPSFRVSAILPLPIGHHSRPSASLLSTVYFLGCLFSENPDWISRSPSFLEQALQYTSQSLSGDHPQRVLHNIQSEILLANYFFSIGKVVQGRYRITAAMSLSVGSGLHKIRSPEALLVPGASDGVFPPATTTMDIAERVQIWWVTLAMDQSWAAAFEVNSYNDGIISESQTPWPLRNEDYIKGRLSANSPSNLVIASYLNGPVQAYTPSSPLELFAKASLLWKQAHLVKEAASARNVSQTFQTTRDRVNQLLNILNGLHDRDPAGAATLIMAACVAHATLLCLLQVGPNSPETLEHSASSSMMILEAIGKIGNGNKHLNPIVTMVWAFANRNLLSFLRTAPPRSNSRKQAVLTAVHNGILAMNRFESGWSSLTS